EINDSRVAMPATIHCWSVASSLHVLFSPFSSRTIHWRSPEPPIGPAGESTIEPGAPGTDSARGCLVGARDRSAAGGGAETAVDIAAGVLATPTLVFARLRILNMCPQFVHLTVTPPGFRRLSSSSYSVWHFSQRTSMRSGGLAGTLP